MAERKMAAMLNVNLKWGKEKLRLEVNPTWSVEELKAKVHAKTNVPPHRQKLSCPKAWKGALADGMALTKCVHVLPASQRREAAGRTCCGQLDDPPRPSLPAFSPLPMPPPA